MSLHCELDLEDGKTIFPQDKMPHDDASSYYIWPKMLNSSEDAITVPLD